METTSTSFTDCPDALLGTLSPYAMMMSGIPADALDANTISGIVLPENVLRQLRLLGMPLSSYTPGQLQAAINACAVDSTLVDDDEGIDFDDMLVETDQEREEMDGDLPDDFVRVNAMRVKPPVKYAAASAEILPFDAMLIPNEITAWRMEWLPVNEDEKISPFPVQDAAFHRRAMHEIAHDAGEDDMQRSIAC